MNANAIAIEDSTGSPKAIQITYWVTTGIFSAMMALSASMYFSSGAVEIFQHLGFSSPAFRFELGVFKIIGAAVLLLPVITRLKEWAYAGFFITLTSAFLAHLSIGDGPDKYLAPIVFGFILLGSYWSFHKRTQRS